MIAKLVALGNLTKQLMWLDLLLLEMEVSRPEDPTMSVTCDNQAVVANVLSLTPVPSTK